MDNRSPQWNEINSKLLCHMETSANIPNGMLHTFIFTLTNKNHFQWRLGTFESGEAQQLPGISPSEHAK